MQLGIDFGTTRTVVACADRGNYPVVGFQDAAGDARDDFPSVVAARGGELRFGLDAIRVAAEPGWTVARSFKRLLAGPAAADGTVHIGDTEVPVAELVGRYLAALRDALVTRSNLPRPRGKKATAVSFTVVIAAPANSHGTQRFLTLDAFRSAGFEVRAMLNEPSAAGFEYTHRYRDTLTRTRELVLVYDLGGGTFDASLVRMSERHHEVVATAGINRLGGDDFDAVLVDLALSAAGLDRSRVDGPALDRLTERCREAKETLHPSTKRISLDLEACLGSFGGEGAGEVTVTLADYAAACEPLVERTLDVMRPLVTRMDDPDTLSPEVAGLYVVGGASALPVVGRLLRERFGRRVHRSPYPFAATAIGLAIAADAEAGFSLEDRFSRSFGVFRDAEDGHSVSFDAIFTPETRVPAPGADPVCQSRIYRAAHNVGHYRLAECSTIDAAGAPQGDLTPAGDVLFPFDPALRAGEPDLRAVPVRRTGQGPLVEETYSIDPNGLVALTIRDLESGFAREYRLGR